MYVDIDHLPNTARVWVYQSDRRFSENEKIHISDTLKNFAHHWNAHGQPLQASFQILEDQFIILAANEEFSQASGCSIDSSVRVFKEIEQSYGIDLFNRSLIALAINDDVVMIPLKDLKQKYEEGIWNDNSFTFNTLADSLGLVRNSWKMAVEKSWLKRYMKNASTNTVAR